VPATIRSETLAAERSRPFRWLVRVGFFSRGVTYGVIGGLALALAAGAGTAGTAANQQGALALIARNWLGSLALVVIAAGLLAYALWKLTQGITGRGLEGGGSASAWDRVANTSGGVAYLVFFAVAIRALVGGGGSGGKPERAAAGVLGWPGGPVIVGIGGSALLAVSLYQLYEGVTGEFAHESRIGRMGAEERRTFLVLGRVGIAARALVFALIGYFVLRAAIDYAPHAAVGVDGALARVHNEPLGPWLLGLVAVGLLVFALFSFAEGRYRRL
jgi:hypothetical protein